MVFLSYKTQTYQVQIGNNSAAIILNFELECSQSKFNEIVVEVTQLISHNNYALLVCGLIIITISMSLILISCHCRRKSYRAGGAATSLLNPAGKSNNGFHRFRNEDQDDEEDLTSIRNNMDDGTKNRISLNMNTSSCRYSKLEETDSKKLLVDSDDDEEENEEKVFAR